MGTVRRLGRMMEFRNFLSSLPAFDGLPAAELDILVQTMRTEPHTNGYTLFAQGDFTDTLYVLLEGSVRVSRLDDAGNAIDAQELRGGEFFGLLSLVDKLPATSTAVTTSPVAVACLEREAYRRLFSTAPSVALRLEYMTAVQLARELQYRNRLLRARMRQGHTV
jgi:CRP/FNR family transcriptional regulator, cyclic AMP receptor protein